MSESGNQGRFGPRPMIIVKLIARVRLFADGGPDEAHHDEEAGEHGYKADRAIGRGGGAVGEGAEQ